MIQHPVKRRGAHNAVKSTLKGQMQKVSSNQSYSHTKVWPEVAARRSQHVLRQIDANDTAPRHSLDQVSRQTARAAPGVEDNLISPQSQPQQYLLAPTDLWPGKAVVHRRIPLARNRWRSISQKKYRSCENRSIQNL